ncbi:MAG: ribose-phosphate diphosphokinase [Candidatus Methanolliviera hydrocarbonicum]|uniref:Ribose-phosphate pyrophosphokinase n=1 Tax=Candidatus Methanolliviera hydrocarbonicum TaxID=2491085 RepID=A0A520KWP1_9EURY|nr:MAG: ribose-phosphate diphosphokinase [Candidatus Methanolliviera hydrocarbonicum]
MKIIGGPSSQLLSKRVSDLLGVELVPVEYKVFPDGEKYCRISAPIEGEEVMIIQSTPSDSDIIYLMELIDACEIARKKTVVIPYFGYSRQDKIFDMGEPISARAIARSIRADRVYTVNIHDKDILKFFPSPAEDLDAMPLLVKYIQEMDLKDPLFIAPDEGSLDAVSNAVSNDFDYDFLEKTRISADDVAMKPKKINVKGRSVVILDDMISTGGTVMGASKMLKDAGAIDIYAFCVHPVLVGSTLLKLYQSGIKEVISTDTLEYITSLVSVAPLIAEKLR